MYSIGQECDSADVKVDLLDERVMDTQVVLVAHLPDDAQATLSVGLIIHSSECHRIGRRQVHGAVFRVSIDLILVNVEC